MPRFTEQDLLGMIHEAENATRIFVRAVEDQPDQDNVQLIFSDPTFRVHSGLVQQMREEGLRGKILHTGRITATPEKIIYVTGGNDPEAIKESGALIQQIGGGDIFVREIISPKKP